MANIKKNQLTIFVKLIWNYTFEFVRREINFVWTTAPSGIKFKSTRKVLTQKPRTTFFCNRFRRLINWTDRLFTHQAFMSGKYTKH